MNDYVESAKDTIREHPTEAAAVAGVVCVLATIFYFKQKEKRTAQPCTHNHGPSWFTRWLEYRTVRLQLKLAALNNQ